MLTVYLPIAEMTVDALVLIGLGAMVGVLSGVFGVGGGFLMTPILLFLGIPPAIAVATQANQLVGASVSGVLAHWRRRSVDFELGLVMMIGGVAGTLLGVLVFSLLRAIGQIDVVITLSYILFLGLIGGLMFLESVRALLPRRGRQPRQPGERPGWRQRLPWKRRFERSKLEISVLIPFGVGFLGGFLVAIMGIGGGFMLVPAMIYIIGMPAALVPGTSLFQIILTTALATFMQAVANQTVDLVLAGLLLLGGVLGAQVGTRLAGLLRPELSRLLLAMLVLGVCGKLLYDLGTSPGDAFLLELP